MTDSPGNSWPSYNVGDRDHLHAVGVISLNYAAFARGMDDLYTCHPAIRGLPRDLIDVYYFSLSEERRLAAIELAFSKGADPKIQALVKNLIEYFNWARDARNTLLHAEQYPALFGGRSDTLYLTKRNGKENRKSVYVTLSLKHLRDIADKMQAGVQQGARVRIFLRVQGVPVEKLPVSLRMFAPESLPEKLRVPKRLKISLTPHDGPIPPHLRKSFDQ